MLIPFTGGKYLDIGWVAIPLMFFVVIGTVNGVNFTDGLDGLASSVTVLVATFFTVVAIGTKSGIEPDYLCGCRSTSWDSFCLMYIQQKCIYGRYRFAGTWADLWLQRHTCFRCRSLLSLLDLSIW